MHSSLQQYVVPPQNEPVWQMPPEQKSPCVQPLPELHGPVTNGCTHDPLEHRSLVQSFKSSQSSGVDTHPPIAQ